MQEYLKERKGSALTRVFVRDLKENEEIRGTFLIVEKQVLKDKRGKPYLSLKLSDKTGDIPAKVWDNIDRFTPLFEKEDFVFINGRTSVYQGNIQVIVNDLRKCDEGEFNLSDFYPVSKYDIEEMFNELCTCADSIANEYLKRLVLIFLNDEGFAVLFKRAPAAKSMHHTFFGGLLEHSLAVVKLINAVTPLYPVLNRDILLTGAMLHDMGKVYELSYEKSFDYTDEGKLLGHISIGYEKIHDRIREIEGFPKELETVIKHIILSHHGELEFGSPKEPMTIEAVVLHYFENLDAKISAFIQMIEKDGSKGNWTAVSKMFGRQIYKKVFYDGEKND